MHNSHTNTPRLPIGLRARNNRLPSAQPPIRRRRPRRRRLASSRPRFRCPRFPSRSQRWLPRLLSQKPPHPLPSPRLTTPPAYPSRPCLCPSSNPGQARDPNRGGRGQEAQGGQGRCQGCGGEEVGGKEGCSKGCDCQGRGRGESNPPPTPHFSRCARFRCQLYSASVFLEAWFPRNRVGRIVSIVSRLVPVPRKFRRIACRFWTRRASSPSYSLLRNPPPDHHHKYSKNNNNNNKYNIADQCRVYFLHDVQTKAASKADIKEVQKVSSTHKVRVHASPLFSGEEMYSSRRA